MTYIAKMRKFAQILIVCIIITVGKEIKKEKVMDDLPRGWVLNLKGMEDAREFLRNIKADMNTSNITVKKPAVAIRVLLESDFDLLKEGMIGMHNMKMFKVVLGEKKYFWEK